MKQSVQGSRNGADSGADSVKTYLTGSRGGAGSGADSVVSRGGAGPGADSVGSRGGAARERALSSHGAERARERTLSAHGAERALKADSVGSRNGSLIPKQGNDPKCRFLLLYWTESHLMHSVAQIKFHVNHPC